jgi:hypothetical protein
MRYKVQIRKQLEAIEIRTSYLKQATEGSKPITPQDAIKMITEIQYSLEKVNELIDLEREG